MVFNVAFKPPLTFDPSVEHAVNVELNKKMMW